MPNEKKMDVARSGNEAIHVRMLICGEHSEETAWPAFCCATEYRWPFIRIEAEEHLEPLRRRELRLFKIAVQDQRNAIGRALDSTSNSVFRLSRQPEFAGQLKRVGYRVGIGHDLIERGQVKFVRFERLLVRHQI